MRNIDVERGARMTAWAERAGLRAQDIALELRVTIATVRSWMSGVGEPRGSQCEALERMGRGFRRKVYGVAA